MKWLFANIVSIGFLALAAYCIYLNRDGWGWCIFGAIVCQVSEFIKNK